MTSYEHLTPVYCAEAVENECLSISFSLGTGLSYSWPQFDRLSLH